MRRGFVCCTVAALVIMGNVALAADSSEPIRLDRAGEAREMRGDANRVIAFFDAAGARLELTLLISGNAVGREILRSRVSLAEGQSHSLRLDGGDGRAAETFTFQRQGAAVDMSVVFSQDSAALDTGEQVADLIQQ